MGTTVVAARIDDDVKEQADKILKAAQLTPTQLVRRVYDYIVITGDVPEFIKVGEHDTAITGMTREQEALREFMNQTDEIISAASPSSVSDFDTSSGEKEELALLLEQKHLYGRRIGIDYDDLSEVYLPEDLGFLRCPHGDDGEKVLASLSSSQGDAR